RRARRGWVTTTRTLPSDHPIPIDSRRPRPESRPSPPKSRRPRPASGPPGCYLECVGSDAALDERAAQAHEPEPAQDQEPTHDERGRGATGCRQAATGDGGPVEDEPAGDGVAGDLAATEHQVVAGGPAPAVAESGADVDDVTHHGVAGGVAHVDDHVELQRWVAQGVAAQVLPRDPVAGDGASVVGADDVERDLTAGDLDGVDGPDVEQVTGEEGVEQARVAGDADGEGDVATDRDRVGVGDLAHRQGADDAADGNAHGTLEVAE